MNVAIGTRPDWSALLSGPYASGGLLFTDVAPALIARRAGGLVYLATPYSLEVVDMRGRWQFARSVEMALRAASVSADLALLRVTAVSPIVLAAEMCHATEGRPQPLDPLNEKFWARWCAPLLRVASAVVVPDLPGWRTSRGIWREVMWALERNVPVYLYGGAE